MKETPQTPAKKYVDGLINPRSYHRPAPKKRGYSFHFRLRWPMVVAALLIVTVVFATMPTVRSFARQFQVYQFLTNGRYLVLFQNDAEIRPSGGFIGSFAVVEAKNNTIKPLYFETNIYKLDTPFTEQVHIDPPKPLQAAIGDGGWALRDSNFAADFRQSGATVAWFFQQEASKATGEKRGQLEQALGGDYHVDGVIGVTMSSFEDILKATGPITIPKENVTVTANNFFPIVQQVVEKDYFQDPNNKQTNEPKTILQDLFPVAMQKVETLPKRTLYDLGLQLLNNKKVIMYSSDSNREATLVAQGWAGAVDLASDIQPKGKSDFLAVIRSSHGGNKSSNDINPIYNYSVTSKVPGVLTVKLDITFQHTGTGEWPSGINHEYLRVLAPEGANLQSALRNGQDATSDVDVGTEANKQAFGFWLHTQPKTSQTFTLNYTIPTSAVGGNYQLVLFRQPGGNDPDITVTYDTKQLFQGRLNSDRLFKN